MGFLDSIGNFLGFGGGGPKPSNPSPMVQPRSVPNFGRSNLVQPNNQPTPPPMVARAPINTGPPMVARIPTINQPSPTLLDEVKGAAKATNRNVVQPVENAAKTGINLLNAGRQGVQGLADIGVAAATHNPTAEQNAIDKTMAAMTKSTASDHGLASPDEIQNADLFGNSQQRNDLLKPVVRGAAEFGPYFIGNAASKPAEDALAKAGLGKVVQELGRRAASSMLQGGTSFGANVVSDLANGQPVNLKQDAKNAIAPAVMGAIFPGKSEAAKTAAAADKVANDKVDTNSFLNGENKNGVKPMTLNNPPTPRVTPPSGAILPRFAKAVADKVAPVRGNFRDTLINGMRQISGHYASSNARLIQLAHEAVTDPNNTENVYHSFEDPTIKLTPGEQVVKDKVQTIMDATQKVKAEIASKDPTAAKDTTQGWIHRIALGKNGTLDKYFKNERQSPAENMTRTSLDSNKQTIRKVFVNNQTGERMVTNVKGGRVVKVEEGGSKTTDMGASKDTNPPPLKKAFDPVQRAAMDATAKALGVANKVVQKIRGNAAGTYTPATKTVKTLAASPDDTMLHEIGHAADDKFDLQKELLGKDRNLSDKTLGQRIVKLKAMLKQLPKDSPIRDDYKQMIKDNTKQKTINAEIRNLTDQRVSEGSPKSMTNYVRSGHEKIATMFQAYLHAPEMFKELAPTLYKDFKKSLDAHPELHNIRDMKPSLQLAAETVGDKQGKGEFIDKTGSKWTEVRGTTKEIEHATGDTYSHDAVMNAALDHANAVHSLNMVNFKDSLTNHPEFNQHAVDNADYSRTTHPQFSATTKKTPSFSNYHFDPATGKLIDQYLGKDKLTTDPLGRAWQAVNSLATQAIIINPMIHTQNLLTQALIGGGDMKIANLPGLRHLPGGPIALAHLAAATKDMADPTVRAATMHDYLQAGGHIPEYGKNHIGTSVVAEAAAKAGSKLNARAMSNIDMNIRVTMYRGFIRSGTKPTEAVDRIDTFLGRPENVGPVAKNIGMFYHWLQTTVGAVKAQASNPIKYAGANVNTVLMGAAITYGVNAAVRAYTGNPNAHVRMPGELGIINDTSKVVNDAIHGNYQQAGKEAVSVGTSHINPVTNAIVNQVAGKDIYSGAPVQTGQEREQELIKNLFAPAANVSKVQGGKMSAAEMATQLGAGIYLPHASGNPAAPNLPGSKLNTPGAKNATGTDKTGYTQETQYYKAKDAGAGALQGSGNAKALAAYNDYFTKNKNDQGVTIQNSPKDTMNSWGSLAGQPKALEQIAKVEGAQPNSNPVWKLSGNGTIINANGQKTNASKLQIYAQYESEANGSADRTQLEQLNPWISSTFKAEQAWFNSNQFQGNSVKYNGPLPAGLTIKDLQYPTLNPTQEALMNLSSTIGAIPVANRTPQQIAALADAEKNPQLQNAYQALDQYNNNMRVAKGYSPINYGPTESPVVSEGIAAYNALPSGTGAKTAWINAHPDVYQQMQDYYNASDLATASKDLAVNELKGSNPLSSAALSSIYNLGKYDIAKGTAANGAPVYTDNPTLAYSGGTQNGVTYSPSSSSSGSTYTKSSAYTSSYPLNTNGISEAGITKLLSELSKTSKITKPKTITVGKKFTNKIPKQSMHVRAVSMKKTERLPTMTKFKQPTRVSKYGIKL